MMMQPRTFFPGSPAFLGQVPLRGIWTGPAPVRPPSLGQAASGQPPQDLPRVFSQDEFARQAWTKDEAVAAYNLANLVRSIMEKVVFSRKVFGQMQAQPSIAGAIQKAGGGEALSNTLASLNDITQRLTLPNAMASALNMRTALEVNVLPKFGIEVRGMAPLFRTSGPLVGTLDCTRIGGTGPVRAGMAKILDFGDLCKTGFVTDMEALQAAQSQAKDIAPEIKLSGPSLGDFGLISGSVVLVLAVIALVMTKMIADTIQNGRKVPLADPETVANIKAFCETVPPDQRSLCYGNFIKNANLYGSPTDVWMWVGLGAGAIAATWIVATLAGAFKKGPSR